MSRVVRLGLIALMLAGCGPGLARQGSVSPPAKLSATGGARTEGACAFYEVTLTVGLVERHLRRSSLKLNSDRGRRQWSLLLAEAHRAAGLFDRTPALHAVDASYQHLLTRLDAADAALGQRDLGGFEADLRAALAPLKDAEAAADKTTLGCKVKSSDGSATLTFGKAH